MPAERPLTLGTAGHIDHGKTALVAALTGVDTDRLPQEKARGISIELGYAPLALPSGRRLSVVDVPGHERFVRTMVAGATGIDVFLLVVACDDGVMPQTREHVAIMRLLALNLGVVALTKRDLVDDEAAALVRHDVTELVADMPMVEVSVPTGLGLDDLRQALDAAAARAAGRIADGPVRLPVDRAFTMQGIGTVVTGTLWSGTVRPGDRLLLEPGGVQARVRSVQVHDRAVDAAAAGQRVAVALTGVERRRARRGQTLFGADPPPLSYRLECEIEVLSEAPRALRHGERVTVHHATAEIAARVAVRDGAELEPGAGGRVQLRLAEPVPAYAGDRVIVRLTAPRTTIAGGTVLDPQPTRSGHAAPPVGLPEAAQRAPQQRPAEADALLQRLAAQGCRPGPLSPTEEQAAAYLAAAGLIVRAGRDLAFANDAFERARDRALGLARDAGAVTVAALRDDLGVSRRYAQALLEVLDAQGLTRREGDRRVLRRRGRDLPAGRIQS